MDCSPQGSSVCGNSPGKNTGVCCYALLWGIFPTQESNLSLPHCTWILYHLSHQVSLRIPELIAYSLSRGSSWPRNWTRVSCIAGGFFTNWTMGEVYKEQVNYKTKSMWAGTLFAIFLIITLAPQTTLGTWRKGDHTTKLLWFGLFPVWGKIWRRPFPLWS